MARRKGFTLMAVAVKACEIRRLTTLALRACGMCAEGPTEKSGRKGNSTLDSACFEPSLRQRPTLN